MDAQWLAKEGKPGRPQCRRGPLRQVIKRYEINGLREDLPWRIDFHPCFALPQTYGAWRSYGLFFTSLLADVFDIHANESAFQCRNWERRSWTPPRPAAQVGTSVRA